MKIFNNKQRYIKEIQRAASCSSNKKDNSLKNYFKKTRKEHKEPPLSRMMSFCDVSIIH